MTNDMRQLFSKVFSKSKTEALASSFTVCNQPLSGCSNGQNFHKRVEHALRDLRQGSGHAGRALDGGNGGARGMFAKARRAVYDIVPGARATAAVTGTRTLESSTTDVGATETGEVALTGAAEHAEKCDLPECLALSAEGAAAVRNDIRITPAHK